jgi:hypothetical protein
MSDKGKYQEGNFICSLCLSAIAAHAATLNRREELEDGSIRYICGNVIAIPGVLNVERD